MDRRFLARLAMPVLVLAALLLVPAYLSTTGPAAVLGGESAGDSDHEDLTSALPDGVGKVTVVAAGGPHPLIFGESSSGRPIAASFAPEDVPWEDALTYLPDYYAAPSLAAASGSRYAVAGGTVGSSPALGIYDDATGEFVDATDVLPETIVRVDMLVGSPEAFLVVGRNGTGLVAAALDPTASVYSPLRPGSLASFARLSDGVWNGSTFYLAGEGREGDPLLQALAPSTGNVTDLSSLIPVDLDRIGRLLWSGEDLYLLGERTTLWSPRASAAVYAPTTGSMTSLTASLPPDCEDFRLAGWNGSTLFVVAGVRSVPTLLTYTPSTDLFTSLEGVLPTSWTYEALIPQGDRVTFLGTDGTPRAGVLRSSTWLWEEQSNAFDSAFQGVFDFESEGTDVLMAGVRSHTAALGRLVPSTHEVVDMSWDLSLEHTLLRGITKGLDDYLLAGSNASGGVLYAFNLANVALEDLTPLLPEGTQEVFKPAWNGQVYVVPGSSPQGAVLTVYDPAIAGAEDLSQAVRHYFREIAGVTAFDQGFLVFGMSDQGAAMATLDVEKGRLTFLGREVAALYGSGSVVRDAAWDGSEFLLGGASTAGPLLSLWSPATRAYHDLSGRVSLGYTGVHHIEWDGQAFYVAGVQADGAALGRYYPKTDVLENLRALLPPSAGHISALAATEGGVMVASVGVLGRPQLQAIQTSPAGWGLLDALPSILRDPTNALILGLAVSLAAVLGYQAAERERKRDPPGSPPLMPTRERYGGSPSYVEEYTDFMPIEERR